MSAVSTGSKFHKSWSASSRFSLHCFFLFWNFLLLSFFLPVVEDDFFCFLVPKTLGRITKFIRSYEEDHFSKTSFKGRGQPCFTVLNPQIHPSSPPPLPLQAINNDWPVTETFPRSMINKSLPQEPTRPHFLRVYQRNNLRGILGEHHLQTFLISSSCNIPNINGFFRWLINRKWSLFLVYT